MSQFGHVFLGGTISCIWVGPRKIQTWNHLVFRSSSAQSMKPNTQVSRLCRLPWQWTCTLFMRSRLFVCLARRVHSARCVFARSVEWSRGDREGQGTKWWAQLQAPGSAPSIIAAFITRPPRVCSLVRSLVSRWPWWWSFHRADHQSSRTSSSLRESDKRPGAAPDKLTPDRVSDTNQALERSTGIHKYLGTKRGLWSLL